MKLIYRKYLIFGVLPSFLHPPHQSMGYRVVTTLHHRGPPSPKAAVASEARQSGRSADGKAEGPWLPGYVSGDLVH